MQHLDLGVQFMKPCFWSGWKMWSHIPCLKKHAKSHGAERCCSVRLLCPEEELPRVPENGLGCDLQLGIKWKPRLGLRNHQLWWIPGIGFQLENPSLLGAVPWKLLYSLISRTSVFLSLKQSNIWIKGSNLSNHASGVDGQCGHIVHP